MPMAVQASSPNELCQLIRGIAASFSHRLSHLISYFLHPMHASSLGALAGFAIALACTWRYLKSPGTRRKKRDKADGPSNTPSEGTSTGTSSAVSLSATQLTQRGIVIKEPVTSAQLTLSQIVRRQLNGGRKMTCQLLGVILEETVPEELQKHAIVRPAVVDVLLELSRSCDLYLLARVLDDESEANIIAALESVGIFSLGGLNRDKVLFCSTEAGRTSFVRQLEPDWHIDTSTETLSQLARFIRHELYVAPASSEHIATNVFVSESLESFFT